jgi:hypothetical protein
VYTDLGEDPGMRIADRLGPDVADSELQQDRGRQDARLQVVADPDHRPGELVQRQLPHRLLVGGVGLDDVRQPSRQGLDHLVVVVDAEHLDALVGELEGERLPEPAQADDGDRVAVEAHLLSQ